MSERRNGNPRIKNVYTFSNLRRVQDPVKELNVKKDMLVINRPWSDSAASRSQMDEEQFLVSLSDLISALSNSGDIIDVTIAPELGENVLEIRQVDSEGKREYFISNKINGVFLDQYLADTFLTIDETLTEEITSNGVGTVGGVEEGYTFPVGMSLVDIMKKIFQKAIPAVYVQSTASIADNVAGTIEVGETFTPTLTITYTQNDSGAPTEARFYRAGVLINTDNAVPFQHVAAAEDFSSDGQTLVYFGQVDHDQGAQKFDNFGDPSGDPAVSVPARVGILTNNIAIYGRRKIFYGVDNPAPSGLEDVRGFGGEQFSTNNIFSISVVEGTTSVEFGIPSHKTLSTVIFVGALVNDETATFLASEQIVATNGAENRYPDNYKVYRYVPSVPFGSSAVYNVTLI